MSSPSQLHGVIPAMVTPFDANERIDYAALEEHIESYVAAGVHGISVAGSQGEFFALEHAERIDLVRRTVQAVRGRVPVYAGTGAVTTRESISLTKAAEADGAAVAMIITPYFVSPSAEELIAHYTAIARATSLPVLLYNNPPRTGGLNVLPATLAALSAQTNIVGIKDSSGDLSQMVDYLTGSEQRARVFIGRDTLILAGLLHGAAGPISPAANVFPRTVVRLYEAVKANRLDEARRLSDLLAPLRAAWAWGSFPVVIKEAMELVGRRAGPTRAPVRALSAEVRARLRCIVEQIQVEETAHRVS
ncbi:MAG: 4-hydroxy-tetrahydrodipicolinate synthase [Proteobacteria bacterium]|nr:4-hydroxy-tetrahydrodipicolinate synthase [Pseudomonadota bacterium]